ncbi:hypothetical protein [Colwellia sp. 12G3]|uniref:hypothetical protein n=1 Tax=Colwellia sp. 12G3 TaxID=2058299 RepID=UPI000C31CD03|nr:hypothetical protein [Colwellia sp. 12G3]PKI12821.1 hypothetical protein CXF71_19010 [Colwellia sp. 12G3]
MKLHILLGGKLSRNNGKSELITNQQSFYYSGIGNRGNWLLRTINAAFTPTYGEMDDILSEAHTARRVRINVDELPSQYLPVVHISIAQRFQQLLDYQPYALRNINYQLLGK